MTKKKLRGFALWDKKKLVEVCKKGGRLAHVKGAAYEWDSEAARLAGRKGGLARRRPVVPDPPPVLDTPSTPAE